MTIRSHHRTTPSSGHVLTPVARALALCIGVLASLAACNLADPGYYLLEKPRTLLLFEAFRYDNQAWQVGATDGAVASWSAAPDGGRFLVTGPRTFILSKETLYGELEIIVKWETLAGDGGPVADSGDSFDFRVVLAGSASSTTTLIGPTVDLKLTPGSSVTIRVADSTDPLSESSEAAQTTASVPESGELRIIARPSPDGSIISAWLDDPALPEVLVSRTVATGWEADHRLALQASAPSVEYPRVIVNVAVLRAEAP